ncbi:Tigger transposable element-derived protein 6, partial [Cucumispora dikerogammari]
ITKKRPILKHNTLSYDQKLRVLEYKKQNKTSSARFIAEKFSAEFKIKTARRRVNNVFKNASKIRDITVKDKKSIKRENKLQYPELDKRVKDFVDLIESKESILYDGILLLKSQQYAEELGLENIRNFMGWLQKFKERNNYQLRTLYGEIYESKLFNTKGFLDIMQQKLIEYSKNDIYNIDKTSLFYKLIPSKTVCKSVRKVFKILKDRVSIALCSNFS